MWHRIFFVRFSRLESKQEFQGKTSRIIWSRQTIKQPMRAFHSLTLAQFFLLPFGAEIQLCSIIWNYKQLMNKQTRMNNNQQKYAHEWNENNHNIVIIKYARDWKKKFRKTQALRCFWFKLNREEKKNCLFAARAHK